MKNRSRIRAGALCLTIMAGLSLFSGCAGVGKTDGLSNNQENTEELDSVMYVNRENCRIRTGPGEWYDTENLLAKGESVTVTERVYDSENNAWCKIDPQSLPADIKLSGEEYYILSSLLSEDKAEQDN